jgi:hypothetical protein
MKNQSILSLVNAVEFNVESLYASVSQLGLETVVDYQAPYEILRVLLESNNPYVESKWDLTVLANNLYLLHKGFFMAKAVETFTKEYK